ncbi:hypothetical protein EMCRGX_G029077 [Ephydatia muelleri]
MSKSSKPKSRSAKKGETTQEEAQVEKGEPEIPQLAWKMFKESELKGLLMQPIEEVEKKFGTVLLLSDYEYSLRDAALIDFFFNVEQTSAFLTLLHTLLDNLKTRKLTLCDNIKELKQTLSIVGASSVTSLRCFGTEQAILSGEYITKTLFQHYRAFEYLLSDQQKEEHVSDVVYSPPNGLLVPPPLEESIPLEFYENWMTSKPKLEPSATQCTVLPEAKDDLGGEIAKDIDLNELQHLMSDMAQQMLGAYQTNVAQKLKQKEEVLLNRISKLEKSV